MAEKPQWLNQYLDFADICVCCGFPHTVKGIILFPLTIIILLIYAFLRLVR